MQSVDKKKAEKIAINFLEQYNSAITIESALLEDEIWIVTVQMGLVNKQTRRVLIDTNSGQILRYADKELTEDNPTIKQSPIVMAVEKALREMGLPTYEVIVQKLYEDYHCYLPDCYEYPEYLNKVLKEIFGDNYKYLVESIKTHLKEASVQKPDTNSLNTISK